MQMDAARRPLLSPTFSGHVPMTTSAARSQMRPLPLRTRTATHRHLPDTLLIADLRHESVTKISIQRFGGGSRHSDSQSNGKRRELHNDVGKDGAAALHVSRSESIKGWI